jgi:hypothetical protein
MKKLKSKTLFKIQNYYRRAKRLNELLGDLDKDKAVKAAFQQEENKSNCSQTKIEKKPMMRRKKSTGSIQTKSIPSSGCYRYG